MQGRYASPVLPCLAFAAFCFSTASVLAGDSNTIHVRQEGISGGIAGNTLRIDQSGANGSVLLGPNAGLLTAAEDLASWSGANPGGEFGPSQMILQSNRPTGGGLSDPALQRGDGNSASATMVRDGGELQLLQDNSQVLLPPGQLQGNTAFITADGAVVGSVVQIGDGNQATLGLTGTSIAPATGLVSQFGTSLSTTLTVEPGGNAQIVQSGENLQINATVQAGNNLTYTQNGNNLPAVVVTTTNPGNITINQTSF